MISFQIEKSTAILIKIRFKWIQTFDVDSDTENVRWMLPFRVTSITFLYRSLVNRGEEVFYFFQFEKTFDSFTMSFNACISLLTS